MVKKVYKFRTAPLLFSIVLTAVSFIHMSANSLPYQDPTVEILEKQMIQIRNAETFVRVGICAIIASIIFFIVIKTLKKRIDEESV